MTADCCPKHKSFYYSEEALEAVWKHPVPRHVAIIMDGNRRWAKEKKLFSNMTRLMDGHWAGAEALLPIVEASIDLGIKILTVYGFSTENWSRTPAELKMLFHILETYLKNNRGKMVEQGVRFCSIGDLSFFPQAIQKEIHITEKATQHNRNIDLVAALNYGGRDDLRRAILSISKDFASGVLKEGEITESLIGTRLDTSFWGDPDLLIRTSGEKRVSNFLLWQLAYSEMHVTEVLWPDFNPNHLLSAVLDFQNRERRFGL